MARASDGRTGPALVVEMVPIDALRPDPGNPRRISAATLDQLEASVAAFGLVQPVLARRADGTVIGGHQRLQVARRRGMTTVPVIWLDLGVDEAHTLNLALNKIEGEWDDDLLARLLVDLSASPVIDVRVAGFDDAELHRILGALTIRDERDRPETFDLASALAAAGREPRVQRGDVWALGDHRLMCGDATDPADVARLLGTDRPAMAITDPPYNVRLGAHGSMGNRNARRKITNDALPAADWATFCRAWAQTLIASVDGPCYVFMSGRELSLISTELALAGGRWSDFLVWRKDRFTPGRSDYQRTYEMMWYGWRDGAPHPSYGDRRETDIWEFPRPGRSPLHPTMKPLEPLERAITNSSQVDDIVLDLFGGSGSILVACERTKRRAVALEIDSRYCAVGLARWEAYAGRKAVRVNGR